MVNTTVLEEKIFESGKTKSHLSKKLGVTLQTFKKKCTGKTEFTNVETKILCDELGIKSSKEVCFIFFAD